MTDACFSEFFSEGDEIITDPGSCEVVGEGGEVEAGVAIAWGCLEVIASGAACMQEDDACSS